MCLFYYFSGFIDSFYETADYILSLETETELNHFKSSEVLKLEIFFF